MSTSTYTPNNQEQQSFVNNQPPANVSGFHHLTAADIQHQQALAQQQAQHQEYQILRAYLRYLLHVQENTDEQKDQILRAYLRDCDQISTQHFLSLLQYDPDDEIEWEDDVDGVYINLKD